MIETQINIIFAILIVNCFVKNLRSNYFNTVDQILRYLASNPKKYNIWRRI